MTLAHNLACQDLRGYPDWRIGYASDGVATHLLCELKFILH